MRPLKMARVCNINHTFGAFTHELQSEKSGSGWTPEETHTSGAHCALALFTCECHSGCTFLTEVLLMYL